MSLVRYKGGFVLGERERTEKAAYTVYVWVLALGYMCMWVDQVGHFFKVVGETVDHIIVGEREEA